MRRLYLTTLVTVVALLADKSYAQILRIDYTGFSAWLDCDRRGAIRFWYAITEDDGDLGRLHSFKIDKDVSESYQQSSSNSHSHKTEKIG